MNGATASEIALGLLLIRLVLPVGILAGLIWAHVRITIANRTKVNLPADVKARLNGLTHQVSEFEETIKRHFAKHAGRDRLKAKAEAEGQPPVAEPYDTATAGVVAPQVGGYVPADVWRTADAGQRAAWEAAGLRSA